MRSSKNAAADMSSNVLKTRFVIYAPRYRNDSGGAIVMHKLCDVLNKLGHPSYVWPLWKPRHTALDLIRTPHKSLSYIGSRLYRGQYTTKTEYDTPIAIDSDIDESVVIYPEIVSKNPLRAQRYARWLLHEPGFHAGRFSYDKGDLYFYYQEAFNKVSSDLKNGGPLTISDTFLDIYRQTNYAPRSKICFMIRKGRSRPDLPDLSNKWIVDELDHHALAKAFNECRICYFYDTHTTYASYAAACGCIPIVVPEPGVSVEEWIPEVEGRHGVAYGDADVLRAMDTRNLMLEYMRATEQNNVESALRFISEIRRHFNL